MREENWTNVHDEILRNLSKKTWTNKNDLFEQLKKDMPEFTPAQALYHAMKHVKLDFKYFPNDIEGEALTEAQDMLRTGYDYNAVKSQVKLKHGVLLSSKKYSEKRFELTRGEYVVVTDPENPKKTTFEHRVVAAKELAAVDNKTYADAAKSIKGKVVVHTNEDVSSNMPKDLKVTDRATLYKIYTINLMERALELKHGSLLKLIVRDKLSRYRPEKLLKDIFNDAGLNTEANKLFGEPEKAEA